MATLLMTNPRLYVIKSSRSIVSNTAIAILFAVLALIVGCLDGDNEDNSGNDFPCEPVTCNQSTDCDETHAECENK
jgi:hypothetical protein